MRRALDWAGRALFLLGVSSLLFVAYQFWGTNLLQDREQRALERELAQRLEAAAGETPRAADAAARGARPVPMPLPAIGAAVGRLEIPAIELDQVVVEGVDRDELRRGPGHYPHSPLPGRTGNAALAGHRTTYGAPFENLDALTKGDEIVVTTAEGRFVYVVDATAVVEPEDVSMVLPSGDDRLTLTTCHPRFSARERLVVTARLVGNAVDAGTAPPAAAAPVELPGEPVDRDRIPGTREPV